VAHLTGGEKEYVVKFFSWWWLLGGIVQAVFMLYSGTLFFHGFLYVANFVIALLLYLLVFRYVRPFMEEDSGRALWITFLVAIPIGAVLCYLSLLGLI
jgi:hypothetical protein